MKQIKYVLFMLVVSLFCLSTVHAETAPAPIKVQFGFMPNNFDKTTYGVVYITSIVEKVTIQSVVVNRGNCYPSAGNPKSSLILNFGEAHAYKFNKCSDVIEAVVTTDQGQWTYR